MAEEVAARRVDIGGHVHFAGQRTAGEPLTEEGAKLFRIQLLALYLVSLYKACQVSQFLSNFWVQFCQCLKVTCLIHFENVSLLDFSVKLEQLLLDS